MGSLFLRIFVLTKTNKIYIIMRTQNTNNRTNKVVKFIALTIAALYGTGALLGAVYIMLNINQVSFNF